MELDRARASVIPVELCGTDVGDEAKAFASAGQIDASGDSRFEERDAPAACWYFRPGGVRFARMLSIEMGLESRADSPTVMRRS